MPIFRAETSIKRSFVNLFAGSHRSERWVKSAIAHGLMGTTGRAYDHDKELVGNRSDLHCRLAVGIAGVLVVRAGPGSAPSNLADSAMVGNESASAQVSNCIPAVCTQVIQDHPETAHLSHEAHSLKSDPMMTRYKPGTATAENPLLVGSDAGPSSI